MATLAELWAGTATAIDIITIWHVDDAGVTHTWRFATHDLTGPISYLGGFVPGCVLACSSDRPGSDPQGTWRAASIRVTFDDTDQRFRRWLGLTNLKALAGATIAHDQVTVASYQSQTTPTRLALGVIQDVELGAEWTIEITATDSVTPLLDLTWPRTFITTTNFTSALARVQGLPEPIVYGVWGDEHPTYGGEWPVIYVGTPRTISGNPGWRTVLVCRHAITSIDSLWVDGVDITSGIGVSNDWLAPGYPNWPDANDYVDINGRRYTLMYVIGTTATALEDGTSVATVALTASYARPALSLAHFLDNFVHGAYESGSALDGSTNLFDDGVTRKRDSTTFTDADSEQTGILGCAWGLREPTPLREILQDAALSGDMTLAVNRSGSLTVWYDETGSLPSSIANGHADTRDIIRGTIQPRRRRVENVLPYSYRPDHVQGGDLAQGLEVSDSTSIAAHGELDAPPVSLRWLRTSGDATTVMTRRKKRSSSQVVDLTFQVPGIHNAAGSFGAQVGRPILVTYREAPGGMTTFGDAVRALSPTHFWRLGEQPEQGLTTALDSGSGAVNGTYVGSPALGLRGPWSDESSGMEADGSNDEITLPSGIATGTTCTFLLWIRPENFTPAGGVQWLFSMPGSSAAVRFLASTAKVDMLYGGTVKSPTTALTFGAWNLIGISISAGAVTFYRNGVADGTASGYGGYTITRLLNSSGLNVWAKGGFKDLAVWVGTALTADQHAALYAARAHNRQSLGWTDKLMRCDRMAYEVARQTMTLDVSQWVTL